MAPQQATLEQLQASWKEVYQQTLPAAARSKLPSQSKWPVQLDHCFARIILDHTVGVDTPWTEKIQSPAYKNMSRNQLTESIELGRWILEGSVNLVELDEESLAVRGKKSKIGSVGMKRKAGEVEGMMASKGEHEVKRRKESPPVLPSSSEPKPTNLATAPTVLSNEKEDLTPYLKKIALCQKTSFQKKVLTTLCQVPKGRYTTYGAMAKHLSSSARAVGNALRNNPFAPEVPCHRVLASGGGLGGFHGSWGRKGEEGLHDDKKRKLLRDEGVRFDGKGKVVGTPWEGFT